MLNLAWLKDFLDFHWLAAVLHWVRYLLNFHWLAGVPLGVAQVAFLLLFVVIGLLVLLIPQAQIHEGVAQPRWWHNLKLWAWGVLVMIFVTYCLF